MEAESGQFQCDSCGRRLRWTTALAGRSVRCPCGAALQCPDAPPGDTYDLAPPPAPAARAHVPPASRAPAGVQPLAYQTPPKAIPGAEPVETDIETLKNQLIPLWLLGGGVAVEIIAALILYRHDLPMAMLRIFIQIVVGTILSLGGVLLTAKIRGIEIGSLASAALRLAAISIAPSAVGYLLMPLAMLIPFVGALMLLAMEFVLYFALLGALFDLDQSDTWWCVVVIFAINLGVVVLLRWALAYH
jgi:hypothetical protein